MSLYTAENPWARVNYKLYRCMWYQCGTRLQLRWWKYAGNINCLLGNSKHFCVKNLLFVFFPSIYTLKILVETQRKHCQSRNSKLHRCPHPPFGWAFLHGEPFCHLAQIRVRLAFLFLFVNVKGWATAPGDTTGVVSFASQFQSVGKGTTPLVLKFNIYI